MKRILIVLSLVLAFSGATFAQSDKAQQATATLQKMRQIDLLNYIVPLALTKEQIRKLLPAIELARRDVKTQEAEEQKLIGEKAAAIDKAVKDGIENGDVPDKQFLKELNALIRFMSMKRDAIANDNTEKVLTAMKEALNVGQLPQPQSVRFEHQD
jgi:formaldehyde-activating enzyme involved in methanogenesis